MQLRMLFPSTGQFVIALLIGISTAAVSACSFCDPSCTNITVALDGTDNTTCLFGQEDCHSLSYVLMNYQTRQNCTKITVKYSHDMDSGVYLSAIQELAIIGEDNPRINCLGSGGLSFTGSTDVMIAGIEWENCGISHETTSVDHNGTSALFFYKCINVTVDDCGFTSQWGVGMSIYDVGGTVHISESRFMNNTTPSNCPSAATECILLGGGLLVEFTECGDLNSKTCTSSSSVYNSNSAYTISNCYFAGNTDVRLMTSNVSCTSARKEGAMAISLQGHSRENTFTINENTFEYNTYSTCLDYSSPHAISSIQLSANTSRNRISLANNMYYHNEGMLLKSTGSVANYELEGGALDLNVACQDKICSGNAIVIEHTNFTENSAVSGAIVVNISLGEQLDTEVLRFSSCSWQSNHANGSGAGVSVIASGGNAISPTITFENCTWEGNLIEYDPNYSHIFRQKLTTIPHYSVVVSEGVPILFAGTTSFHSNQVTAVYLVLTTASFTGEAEFVNNTSVYGGAIYLDNLAWIILLDNLTLTFTGNMARFGGAIYTTFQCYNASSVAYCTTFGNSNGGKLCPGTVDFPTNTNISFVHNYASISGNAIYLDSRICSLDCLNGENFVYIPADAREISAPANAVTFNQPAVNDSIDIWLGKNIFLNTTTSNDYTEFGDEVIVPAVAVTTVFLNCQPYYTVGEVYRLIGPTALFLENKAFFSNMKVVGPEISTSNQPSCVLLFVTTGSKPELAQNLKLNFVPCQLGYVYNEETEMCECFDSTRILCEPNTLDTEVCIEYGYWYGRVSKDTYTVSSCPGSFCKFNYGQCPIGPCHGVPGFCLLPEEQDSQCTGFRGGPLCTNCVSGYSFTFGAVECVRSDTCTVGYAMIPLVFVIAFWVMMIVALLMILKFNLRVGSGYLYSFIYFFSVLDYVTPQYLPSYFLDVVVTFFSSIAKLNPAFIGEFPSCFIGSLTSIGHEFFQYIHALFISGVIVLVVMMARSCPKLPNPAKNSGIHAICILMLLSFSSLLEISFSLLNPVTLDDEAFVNIQADTRYFDPKDHLPFALIAILVLLVIVLPFIFLMLFSPLLMRCGANLTRIKPILDEYQACYKDKCRWVAGYYFLCRFVVFFLSIFDFGVYGNIYMFQIIFLLIFGFHTAVQPYTANWLNVVDAVLLLDLTLITFLYGSTADVLFTGSAQGFRSFLLHILILIPCLYFLAFFLYIAVSVTGAEKRFYKLYERMREKKMTINPPIENAAGNVYDDRDREPLLALLSDNGAHSAAQYQALVQVPDTVPGHSIGALCKSDSGHSSSELVDFVNE